MATREEIRKIRALQEKGTITAEQAEELIQALSEEKETGRGSEDWTTSYDPERGPWSGRQGREERPEEGRHHHRHGGPFPFDQGWVDELVNRVASRLSNSFQSSRHDQDSGRYRYDYSYEWDPSRAWRSFGRNMQNLSRVEQPEGEDYEFRDNEVAFSKLHDIRLLRSKMTDNQLSASTFRDAKLSNSVFESNSLTGASLQDLSMETSKMKGNHFAGAKLNRVEMSGDSAIINTRVSGGNLTGVSLIEGSRIEEVTFAAVNVGSLHLGKGSRIKKSRLTALNLQGTKLTDSLIKDVELAKANFVDAEMTSSKVENSRIVNVEVRSLEADRIPTG